MKKIIKLLFVFIIVFFLFPYALRFIELSKLQNKVILVNQLLKGNVYSNDARRFIQTDVSFHYQDVEKGIDTYLIDLIDCYDDSQSFLNEDYHKLFSIDFLKDSSQDLESHMENVQNYQKELMRVKDRFEKLSTNKERNLYYSGDSFSIYKKLFQRFHKEVVQDYLLKLDTISVKMSRDMKIFEYLVNHSDDWIIKDDVIEFQKRKSYEEFQLLSDSHVLSYQLVHDIEGPIIEGDNMTIYLKNELDLSSKFRCFDSVDGDIDCQIEGSYDNLKVGEYPIHVKAIDVSGNASEKDYSVRVIQKVNTKPYEIDVIRNQNVVIVYYLDEFGERSGIAKVFICSTGKNNATPTGTFNTAKGAIWGALYGGVWGQYTTRIVGSILFHSVPYYSRNKADLEWEEYNKLGTQASLGCVRMTVQDVKWIFYNCPVGTKVHIYDGELPNGVMKPSSIKIEGNSAARGWDPTDDDPSNMWK